MANTHRSPDQWQKIFEQYSASGMTISIFCKQHKINPSSFYAWRKRLVNHSICSSVADKPIMSKNNQPDWVGIIPEQIADASRWDIELTLPSGVVLRMMNH
jgi:putative transposase